MEFNHGTHERIQEEQRLNVGLPDLVSLGALDLTFPSLLCFVVDPTLDPILLVCPYARMPMAWFMQLRVTILWVPANGVESSFS